MILKKCPSFPLAFEFARTQLETVYILKNFSDYWVATKETADVLEQIGLEVRERITNPRGF